MKFTITKFHKIDKYEWNFSISVQCDTLVANDEGLKIISDSLIKLMKELEEDEFVDPKDKVGD